MEVILLEDVKALGKKGEIVKVNDGYARNFILPKKLGIEASQKNLNELKLKKLAEEKQKKEILTEAQELGKALAALKVVIKIKTGDNGKVFGSVSTKEIATELKDQHHFDIDKKKIQLPDSIKNVGEYEVPIKLHPAVTVALKVSVVGL